MQLTFINTPENCQHFLRACSLHNLLPLKIKLHNKSTEAVATFSKNEGKRTHNIAHWINSEVGKVVALVTDKATV